MNLLVIVAVIMSFSIEMAMSTKWSFNRQSSISKGDCVSGDGSSYRGTVSHSESGRPCLNWGGYSFWGVFDSTRNHNYCRNPNGKLKPWCRVQGETGIVREYCKIPQCSTSTVKPRTVEPQDTELTCGQTSERKLYRVVGGSFTRIESQPWVAAIFTRRGTFLCGASLITPCWVVTAAHCFDGLDQNVNQFTVYLGKSAINETNVSKDQKFMVEKLVIHRKYNASNYDNDIALLKIKNQNGGCAVKSATTRTVCLPPFRTQLPVGFQCTIAGYGKEDQYAWAYSNVLKEGHVNLLSQSECRRKDYYGGSLTGNMFCAAHPSWSIDSCKGDSGGPLLCKVAGRMFLFGVVSWGDGCANRNKPGVYTKVTNYNRWIAKNTGLPKYTAGIMYPTK
ncbi:hypothetical protein NL108_012911 [Boleophthalmus pectinirostris]|uniref:urokinase-type plasminogen activator n=1 Tax=Boleophthalmus pectinirostris TaxID=150288 RepID=UPI000A1C6857|nr:urokinase-type plasminogen activator [Boleophthalmus pectinirostris]KAJ0067181.1 hypothetical protein NL108_012911 [Boleophthalmus pectinirostris]